MIVLFIKQTWIIMLIGNEAAIFDFVYKKINDGYKLNFY